MEPRFTFLLAMTEHQTKYLKKNKTKQNYSYYIGHQAKKASEP
jgi:hypothetical protein